MLSLSRYYLAPSSTHLELWDIVDAATDKTALAQLGDKVVALKNVSRQVAEAMSWYLNNSPRIRHRPTPINNTAS